MNGSGGGHAGTGGNTTQAESEYCQQLFDEGNSAQYELECTSEIIEIEPSTPVEAKEALQEAWDNSVALPSETRAEAPPWEPPFPVGEPGWKDSEEPFCEPFVIIPDVVGLWADERGVFAATARHCLNTLAGDPCDPVAGSAIYQNHGNGWELLATPGTRAAEMTALPDGDFLFGMDVRFSLSDGVTALENPFFGLDVKYGVATSGSSAFAASSPNDLFSLEQESTIVKLNGSRWEDAGDFPGQWGTFGGDEEGKLYFGRTDELLIGTPDSVAPLEGVPAGAYNYGLWADSPTRFYVANQAGQLVRFDGEFHIDHEFSNPGQVQFRRGGDRLYFIDHREFGYISATNEVVVVAKAPAPSYQFTRLAADADGNAFVSLMDAALDEYACGAHVILAYDGSEFHRF